MADEVVSVVSGGYRSPGDRPFEIVERKGLGHPDTMADLIADQFSYAYCRYCLEQFGHVLNHAVDKVTLVGASSRVYLGGFEIIQPARVMLIGKVTPSVGANRVPIFDLLRAAVVEVYELCLPDRRLLDCTVFDVLNTFSTALDRPAGFYYPATLQEAAHIEATEREANDTVFCTGSAPLSELERLVLAVEATITAPSKRGLYRGVGTDVKVLGFRSGHDVDVTVCVPVDPGSVSSPEDYRATISAVTAEIGAVVAQSEFADVRIHVNSKDVGGGMYLTPFGTSLGKSDCGAVGRGNRNAGVIGAFRPVNVEAPSGKNPLHHAGRLLTFAAQRIADRIWLDCHLANSVFLVARNGESLQRPAALHVEVGSASAAATTNVRRIATEVVESIPQLSDEIISVNPVEMTRAQADARCASGMQDIA